jgi:hypothetical protein
MDDLFLLHEVALAGGLAVEGGAVAGVLAAGRNGKLGPAGAAPPALQAHERCQRPHASTGHRHGPHALILLFSAISRIEPTRELVEKERRRVRYT